MGNNEGTTEKDDDEFKTESFPLIHHRQREWHSMHKWEKEKIVESRFNLISYKGWNDHTRGIMRKRNRVADLDEESLKVMAYLIQALLHSMSPKTLE